MEILVESHPPRGAGMATPRTKAGTKLRAISPQFVVPDVVAAAEYYRDTLGFEILGFFGEPPVFAMVARDAAEIHFGKADHGEAVAPNATRRKSGLDAYIWADNVDSLHEELHERGAKIIEGPVRRSYNCCEITVEDRFGFRLVFGSDCGGPANSE